MHALPGILLVYALAVLLATSSPIGAGQGLHRDQLLDVLLPHVHFLNGQRIDVGEATPVGQVGDRGWLYSGNTVVAEAFTPVPRSIEPLLTALRGQRRLPVEDRPAPRGRVDAPPDPPPNSWS